MTAQNPQIDLNKSLFEEPAGLLGIPAHETRVRIARNRDLTTNTDHLQDASVELIRRMALGWRVRRTPATNYHCGLYAVYQGFVALSRRFPHLIPGPVPTLDDVYNWLVRDRRQYQRFVYQHGDFSAVGDLAAFTFVHNFSSEQLDLLATWLGQQSNCSRSIRVVSLLQDRTSSSTLDQHYMVHGRISTPIDTTTATGELYLFVHYAPATLGSLAHWSMFSDRDWEFQAQEDPSILNGTETATAEDNWEHEERERLSKPPLARYPPNLPSAEKLAWVCGHLTRNPMTNYKSAAKPRTEVTPQQLSKLLGLGLKDSNIRKMLQIWREKQKNEATEASKWLVNNRTASDQLSLLRGKAKPRLLEYQRDLIDLGRINEATNVDALRQYIDDCETNSTAGSTAPVIARSNKPTTPVGARPAPSTPPPPAAPGYGPYYLRTAALSISPGKTYPAPRDKDGKRVRTPPGEKEEEDSSSDKDGRGRKRKKRRRKTSSSSKSSDNNPPHSPHSSDDGNAGGSGAVSGPAGAQPPTASGSGQPPTSGAGGSSGGANVPTPYLNVDPQLLNLSTLAHAALVEPVAVSRPKLRRRSWPLLAVTTAQRFLKRGREQASQGSLSSGLAPSDAGVNRVRQQRVRFVRRAPKTWLKRVQQSAVEGMIVFGLSVGSFAVTHSLLSIKWQKLLTAAPDKVVALDA